MLAGQYFMELKGLIKRVEEEQMGNISKAADAIAGCFVNGGILHVFGTGHSHMFAEELFYRAGGLVPVNPILEPSIMLHHGARKSTDMERLSGLASVLAAHNGIKCGDVIIIASNSGRNAVPVEMATAAKELGATSIAITSLLHSRSVTPRAKSGQRLFEVADIVIDNCGVIGDAIVQVGSLSQRICPTSTVVGAAIVNAIVAEVVEKLVSRGIEPPILQSANIDGDEVNANTWVEHRRVM